MAYKTSVVVRVEDKSNDCIVADNKPPHYVYQIYGAVMAREIRVRVIICCVDTWWEQ